MPKLTLALAAALVILALGFFAYTRATTALIPLGPAVLFAVLGGLALTGDRLRMHTMHVAAGLSALLALLGIGMAFPKVVLWQAGDEVERLPAAVEQGVMGLLCLLFLFAAFRSFIKARRLTRGGHAIPS